MTTASTPAMASKKLSIPRLRRLLLIVLTLSVVTFTVGVYVLVQRIFHNFGPGVQEDLIWKTVHGAEELAHASDLGLAVKDRRMVTEGFASYIGSADVQAIAAVAADDSLVARIGDLPEPLSKLFWGPAAIVRRTSEYFVAWAPALVEGSPVGKVAIVVKTQRLVEAQALLHKMSLWTGVAGIVVWVLGVFFVNFFTRSIVERDAQLAEYAAGLEQKVAERTAALDRANEGMRLVLDNVEQGFIMVSRDGVMAEQRSAIVDRWFGVPPADRSFSSMLRPFDPEAADWFAVGCDDLRSGFMPPAVVITHLPRKVSLGDRTLRVSYTGIGTGETPERLLIVSSDVTAELARERIEQNAREMTRAFQRISADRAGFEQFFAEAGDIVRQILAGAENRLAEQRLIHTLKGNCSIFGVDSVAEICHHLETQLEDQGRMATGADHARLGAAWDRTAGVIAGLLGDRPTIIELEESDYQELLTALRKGTAGAELIALVESWRAEPVSLRLQRLSDKARYLAKQLKKDGLTVHIDGGDVRLDGTVWTPFWAALVHAVNNALDHGIEFPEVRAAHGKAPAGNLWLSASGSGDEVVISVRDDGRGIDWDRLKERAAAAHLPHATHADLVPLLFNGDASTTEAASMTSGRGVGMGVLQQVTAALGGQIDVTSEPSQGTTFAFRFRRGSKAHGRAVWAMKPAA